MREHSALSESNLTIGINRYGERQNIRIFGAAFNVATLVNAENNGFTRNGILQSGCNRAINLKAVYHGISFCLPICPEVCTEGTGVIGGSRHTQSGLIHYQIIKYGSGEDNLRNIVYDVDRNGVGYRIAKLIDCSVVEAIRFIRVGLILCACSQRVTVGSIGINTPAAIIGCSALSTVNRPAWLQVQVAGCRLPA